MTAYARAPRDVAAEAAESLTRYLHGDEVVTATDDGRLILRLRHEDRGARPVRLQEMAYHADRGLRPARLPHRRPRPRRRLGPDHPQADPEVALEYADAAARESVRQRDLQPLGAGRPRERRSPSIGLWSFSHQVLLATVGSILLPFLGLVAAYLVGVDLSSPLYWGLVGALGITALLIWARVLPRARAAGAAGRAPDEPGAPGDGGHRGVPAQRGRHHRRDARGVPAPGVLRRAAGRARLQHPGPMAVEAAAAADGADAPRPRRDPRRGQHLEGAERQRRAARRRGRVRRHLRRRPPPDGRRLRARLALAGRRRRRRPGPLRDPQRRRQLAGPAGRRRVRADLRRRPPGPRRRCTASASSAAPTATGARPRSSGSGCAARSSPRTSRPRCACSQAGGRIVNDPGLVSRELAPDTLEGAVAASGCAGRRAGSRSPAGTSGRALRSPHLSLRQKARRRATCSACARSTPWLAMLAWPLMRLPGLARRRASTSSSPIFTLATLFIAVSGPVQTLAAWRLATPELRRHPRWFVVRRGREPVLLHRVQEPDRPRGAPQAAARRAPVGGHAAHRAEHVQPPRPRPTDGGRIDRHGPGGGRMSRHVTHRDPDQPHRPTRSPGCAASPRSPW